MTFGLVFAPITFDWAQFSQVHIIWHLTKRLRFTNTNTRAQEKLSMCMSMLVVWWWCYISVRQPGPCITLRSASYTCNMTTLHVRRCQALICQNLPTVFNISKIRLTLHNYATIQHFNISNMLKTQSIIRLCIYSPVLFWFKSPIPWIQYTIFSVHHIHIPSHIFVFNKYNKFSFYSTEYSSHSKEYSYSFFKFLTVWFGGQWPLQRWPQFPYI